MVSAISGTFLESSLYEPRRNKRAKAISWSAHALGLLLLWLAPSALPEPPTMPGAHLPTLVFVAEPGPGGGGEEEARTNLNLRPFRKSRVTSAPGWP